MLDKIKFKEMVSEYLIKTIDSGLAELRLSLIGGDFDKSREEFSRLLNAVEHLQKTGDIADKH